MCGSNTDNNQTSSLGLCNPRNGMVLYLVVWMVTMAFGGHITVACFDHDIINIRRILHYIIWLVVWNIFYFSVYWEK